MSANQQIALETIRRMLTNSLPTDESNPFMASAETMSATELQVRWDAQNASILAIVSAAL